MNSKNLETTKKVELGWMTPTSRNGPISFELIWLICFKLILIVCKHRIWYYKFWFRKCVKLIWIKLIWPCISGLTVETKMTDNKNKGECHTSSANLLALSTCKLFFPPEKSIKLRSRRTQAMLNWRFAGSSGNPLKSHFGWKSGYCRTSYFTIMT